MISAGLFKNGDVCEHSSECLGFLLLRQSGQGDSRLSQQKVNKSRMVFSGHFNPKRLRPRDTGFGKSNLGRPDCLRSDVTIGPRHPQTSNPLTLTLTVSTIPLSVCVCLFSCLNIKLLPLPFIVLIIHTAMSTCK